MNPRQLGRGQRALVLVVITGTVAISLIGFVGSYDAVLRLAQRNGFGWFSYLLPIGIDVGITVFLALDLLLTWMRIPLPILRQLAWVLTGATIVFNAASAWPNPLASGMHGVVPLLFVAAIEAARHTVGRLAQIEANQLFERTRLGRWVFAPIATMRLFRRRVLWELRSYEEALEHERRRLVYRARLRAVYGRLWRFKAPVDFILLLKLANLGEPLPEFKLDAVPALPGTTTVARPDVGAAPKALLPQPREEQVAPGAGPEPAGPAADDREDEIAVPEAEPAHETAPVGSSASTTPAPAPGQEYSVVAKAPMEQVVATPQISQPAPFAEPAPMRETAATSVPAQSEPLTAPIAQPGPSAPAQGSAVAQFHHAFNDYTEQHGAFPDGDQLSKWLFEHYGITGRSGDALSPGHLRRYLPRFRTAWDADKDAELSATQQAGPTV